MNTDLIFGCAALMYGIFTLILRFARPDSPMFGKLLAMRKQWGHRVGTTVHWIAYTVLPIAIGSTLLLRGLAR